MKERLAFKRIFSKKTRDRVDNIYNLTYLLILAIVLSQSLILTFILLYSLVLAFISSQSLDLVNSFNFISIVDLIVFVSMLDYKLVNTIKSFNSIN